jgi:thiol-disulfide isomerase/thioredoxin
MSVPDAYLARAGTYYAVPRVPWLAIGAGARLEGVPTRDLIGDSDGFRRPGYTLSIEPGATVSSGSWVFSVAVPIAMLRNRLASVPDQRDGTHGDASFADFSILASVTHTFRGSGDPASAPASAPFHRFASPPAALGALDSLAGGRTRLEPLLGTSFTVVNVWGTFCEPCRQELPALAGVRARYAGRGVEIIAMAIDDDVGVVRAFVQHEGIQLPIVVAGAAASERLGISTIPTTLLLDASGAVVEMIRGPLTGDELAQRLDRLLRAGSQGGGAGR